MRKLFLIVALASSLAGCKFTEDDTPQSVIDYAIGICSFRPTFESAAAMLAAPYPTITGAFQIAMAICTAVTPATALGLTLDPKADKDGCPKINDICVEGDFVPKPEEK